MGPLDLKEGDIENFTENAIAANWQIHLSRVNNSVGCRIPVRSSWNLDRLEQYLADYEDREIIKYLQFGWPVGCLDTGTQTIPINHKGARENASEVREYLKRQSENGTLIGPV